MASGIPTFDTKKCAHKLFQNEAGGKHENLVFWNPKESFPSMGIAHFIWIRKDMTTPFSDSFGPFLTYCEEQGIALPSFLTESKEMPWSDRNAFLKDTERPPLLRRFLEDHFEIQFRYVYDQFQKCLPVVLDSVRDTFPKVDALSSALMETEKGFFALYDYLSFKDLGLTPKPEYNDVNWGLKQALVNTLESDWEKDPLDAFIAGAKKALRNRVENAPPELRIKEEGYIPGWDARLEGYREDL